MTPNATFSPDPTRLAKGKKLVETLNCSACHGAGLLGHDEFPRLAGQGHDYLVKQLSDFKHGVRQGANGTMAAAATALTDDDIENLAHYLASQRAETHEH